ncbi:hypothetical protein BN938_1122 [Mucinivorans hirudinis]|uniref:Uncharacterized protein n=1 Tax=Mucinivorans hirudinis TaxID=1433126 RepID=A0A060R7K5_9BACT|nr:hypothetical protein BN938_1122 [Mucinivorans hirudinis]
MDFINSALNNLWRRIAFRCCNRKKKPPEGGFFRAIKCPLV